MGLMDSIKKKIIKQKAQEFLGDNIEIIDNGDEVIVSIKNKKFDIEIQGIKVVFQYEDKNEEVF